LVKINQKYKNRLLTPGGDDIKHFFFFVTESVAKMFARATLDVCACAINVLGLWFTTVATVACTMNVVQ
jgi:hypothetical protein